MENLTKASYSTITDLRSSKNHRNKQQQYLSAGAQATQMCIMNEKLRPNNIKLLVNESDDRCNPDSKKRLEHKLSIDTRSIITTEIPRANKNSPTLASRILVQSSMFNLSSSGIYNLLNLAIGALVIICLFQSLVSQSEGATVSSDDGGDSIQSPSKAALEAELQSLLEQHELKDTSDKLIAEAIISRLMLGNLTGTASNDLRSVNESVGGELDAVRSDNSRQQHSTLNELTAALENNEDERQNGVNQLATRPNYSGPDGLRLKKLISYLDNAELSQLMSTNGLNGGQVFSQYPVLPSSQAATIKRASMKMNNLLRQQQASRQISNGFNKHGFDFGLGKRPDSSISSNLLRMGDSSVGLGGNIQTVSGHLGNRQSHRFDFGLGKRVASPANPRYDFGLGKRAASRLRFDFGLGR